MKLFLTLLLVIAASAGGALDCSTEGTTCMANLCSDNVNHDVCSTKPASSEFGVYIISAKTDSKKAVQCVFICSNSSLK